LGRIAAPLPQTPAGGFFPGRQAADPHAGEDFHVLV
jgi:hypothetical protein